jgi:hypothetical protein
VVVPDIKPRDSRSQRIEKRDEFGFLLFARRHLKSLIVKIYQLSQVCCGAIVEIGDLSWQTRHPQNISG